MLSFCVRQYLVVKIEREKRETGESESGSKQIDGRKDDRERRGEGSTVED